MTWGRCSTWSKKWRGLRARVLAALSALVTATAWSDEFVARTVATSPDTQKRLEATMWLVDGMFCRIDIVLLRNGRKIFTRTVPPDREVHYVKLAWSPSSDAALVGLNAKAAEDLL